ncbi:hypothetical protein [Kingella sp. (in: b-proteobacteria)]|uniref:hypothetical protein n=1 Tax=Kingella sp. (in: b-proteobacteria) TaxID=2020713 RepID=UPI0026DC41E9|nr:hypothetical protein [Kingella sp. (in: b-proteobacteria)]MDO4656622.1 hypothetical protein [Kingella sp. (in: b-proteobacteria)]
MLMMGDRQPETFAQAQSMKGSLKPSVVGFRLPYRVARCLFSGCIMSSIQSI